MNDLRVRNLVAGPGEKTYGWLKVAEMQDSRPAELPIILINGAGDGPTLYMQAAVDGNELNPIAVIRKVTARIDPQDLSGKIIAVVLTNFFGFHAKEQWNPVDKISLNRVWPGSPNGFSSARIVNQLWSEAVLQANYAMDCHQTSTIPSVESVYVRVGKDEPHYDEAFEMARICGLGHILDEKLSKIFVADLASPRSGETKLSWNATVKGIPTITPEICGSRGWNWPTIELGIRGAFNVLKWLRMMPGEPELPKRQYVASTMVKVVCNRGGFLEHKVKLGDIVRKDDEIADVTDPFGRVLETLLAPRDAIVWSLPEYPMVSTGETVASLGTDYQEIS